MKNFFRSFSFFLKRYTKSTITAVILISLAGVVEAIGIMAFLPFLQIVFKDPSQTNTINPVIQNILDAAHLQPTFGVFALFIAAAIGLKAFILWLSMRYVSQQVAVIADDFRISFIKALTKADWAYFKLNSVGGILNSLTMETFRSSQAFLLTTRVLASVIQFSVYAVSALIVSWQVFVGGIIVGTVLVVMLWELVRSARRAGVVQTETERGMLSNIGDMLQGLKPLRAMALEEKFMPLAQEHSLKLRRSHFDQTFTKQCIRIFHEPLMVFSVLVGIYLITNFTNLGISEFALMGILFIRMLTSLNAAQGEYQSLVVQEGALWAFLDTVKNTERAKEQWPGTQAAPESVRTITFQDLGFSYGDRNILSGANIAIEPNKLTAFIGKSGSGKSTCLDLLAGFYLPETGKILADGTDISQFDLQSWRRKMGFVPQDVFLLNDTIFENIVVGRKFSEQQVWEAVEASGAKEFIDLLPQGIHAPVGENGRLLSGGQKQRIAIARAIIHHPQILLLDEATSALDAETEKKILKTLHDLTQHMSVICVSHNRRVIDFSDHVYEFRNGEILAKEPDAQKLAS